MTDSPEGSEIRSKLRCLKHILGGKNTLANQLVD